MVNIKSRGAVYTCYRHKSCCKFQVNEEKKEDFFFWGGGVGQKRGVRLIHAGGLYNVNYGIIKISNIIIII